MPFFFQRFNCFRPIDAPIDTDVSNNTILVAPPCTPVTIPPPNTEFGKKPGYIYLLREREFLKTNEEIYKIGKTINIQTNGHRVRIFRRRRARTDGEFVGLRAHPTLLSFFHGLKSQIVRGRRSERAHTRFTRAQKRAVHDERSRVRMRTYPTDR